MTGQTPRLMDRVREALRVRHYSLSTERTYCDWIRRYTLFSGKRHAATMGAEEVAAHQTHLAVMRGVLPSTRNESA